LDKNITGLDLLDKVAEVTQPATTAYKEIMELNQHPRLKVPEIITSWEGMNKPIQVKLSEITEKMSDE
jgi:hypothetical protein